MILKIFLPQKIGEKIWAFLTQNKAKLFKSLIITFVFEKNANFFAENCHHTIDPIYHSFTRVSLAQFFKEKWTGASRQVCQSSTNFSVTCVFFYLLLWTAQTAAAA
jgi:hypothetical protein